MSMGPHPNVTTDLCLKLPKSGRFQVQHSSYAKKAFLLQQVGPDVFTELITLWEYCWNQEAPN